MQMGGSVPAGGFPDHAFGQADDLVVFGGASQAGEVGHFAKASRELQVAVADPGICQALRFRFQLARSRTVMFWSEHDTPRQVKLTPGPRLVTVSGCRLAVARLTRVL